MKLLVSFLKVAFPLLLFTDLGSEFLNNEFILNISRGLRILLLSVFLIENIRLIKIVKKFYFFYYFLAFAAVMFGYIFTDQDMLEAFWIFSKMLFWITGINVFFAYSALGYFTFDDYMVILKRVIIGAFIFSVLFLTSGLLNTNYNVAAYLVLFMIPGLLMSSKGFEKNLFYLFLAALSIIITLKRGAMLGFFTASIIYYSSIATAVFDIKKLFMGLIVIGALIFVGSISVSRQETRSAGRFDSSQLDLDNDKAGSGRIGIYRRLYTAWSDADLTVHLFGFGNQEDSRRVRNRRTHAHSDLLGFLYNHGLFGVALIFWLYIRMIRFYFFLKKHRHPNAAMSLVILSVLILVNIYSGLFRTTDVIYLFGVLPLLQASRY